MKKNPAGASQTRDAFRSKFGFIVACVGSAVGMGNIWMFPYRTGQYGGAAFLIPYFIFVAILGFSGVVGEMAFGRAMKTGPSGAFGSVMEMRGLKGGRLIGMIPVLGSLAIGIGYSVVVGWFLRFLWGSLSGTMFRAPDVSAYFGEIAGGFGSVGWHMAGLAVTFLIMAFGVSKGIEKMNKVMMPLFFVFFLFLMVRVLTLGNVGEAINISLCPNGNISRSPKPGCLPLGRHSFPCLWQGRARWCTAVTCQRMWMWWRVPEMWHFLIPVPLSLQVWL